MQFLNLTFNRLIAILIISLLSACNSKTVTTPSKRGVKPVLVQDIQGSKFLYSSSHALLIGESDYTNGWDDLNSIPGELQDVKNVLESQGFQVEMRLNLNGRQLREQFKTFIDNYGFKNNNRLLFFFSGHGHTRNDKGYIVPTDAPDPNLDKIGFLRKAVGMDQILTWARRIEAKHVLFLFDSCFSGTAFKAKGKSSIPRKIQQWTKEPVRQFITAGSANETVPARSVFTPAFVDAIRYGWGDTYQDGYITGEELAYYLKNKVSDHSDQNPQSGTIKDYELSRGDFVFVLADKKPNVTPIPPPKPAIITITNHSIQVSSEGSCEEYSFPLRSDNQSINTTWPLRVLGNNAPVYYNAKGNHKKTTLKFGKVLDALRISYSRTSGRVEICKSGCLPDEALGWMDRQDLLCRIKPLKNQEGLERKAFTRTATQASPSNRLLSNFEMYFIFATKQQQYLLADKYYILMGEPLIGWVDKNKMIPWNTMLQIRPKEQEYLYAYINNKKIKIRGGNFWYKYPLHLPLLNIKHKRGKQYYHVAIPKFILSREDAKLFNDSMTDAYIPISNKLVKEIWISSRELDNWKSVLRPLYKIKSKGFNQQKREFIRILGQELQNILGEPLLIAGETLGEVIKRKNWLPVREHSPFMQYTKQEILNMQRCEFFRLINWIASINGLINRLTSEPTKKIEYELSPYADSQCPRVSAKGRNIQRLSLKPPKPLGPSDEYRYDHSFRGETIYTIPINFLP
jgi:hypothetical protein